MPNIAYRTEKYKPDKNVSFVVVINTSQKVMFSVNEFLVNVNKSAENCRCVHIN